MANENCLLCKCGTMHRACESTVLGLLEKTKQLESQLDKSTKDLEKLEKKVAALEAVPKTKKEAAKEEVK